jgi:methionine sulfoxide reductase heme-binding subunit
MLPELARDATDTGARRELPGAAGPALGPRLMPGSRPTLLPMPTTRVPARPKPGPVYRGLPRPVRYVAWAIGAVAVGSVLGATAPNALRNIGAVAALHPGLLGWYSVRALGFLAYIILAASVLYGLLLSTKLLDAIAHRPVSFALHKDLAIAALLAAALHGTLLITDQSFSFTPRAILVPFESPYAPILVGVGQLTFYAMAIVTASFYVRRHIGQRAWRTLHYVSFLAFAGATFHGISAGSDSGQAWAFWIYLIPIAAAVFLLTYRIVLSASMRRAGAAESAPSTSPMTRPTAIPDRRLIDPSFD